MPPYGLYTMGRNHLYGGRAKPKVYNTNSFKDDSNQLVMSEPATPANMDGAGELPSTADDAKKKKKAKKEKRQSLNKDKNDELDRMLSQSVTTPTTGETKKDKKKHRKSTPAPVSAPVSESKKTEKSGTVKKRKRESDAHTQAANAQLLNEASLASKSLAAIVPNTVRSYDTPTQNLQHTPKAVEQPSKKKNKRKSETGVSEPKEKKAKHKGQADSPNASIKTPVFPPVPSDWVDGSDELSVKKYKMSMATSAVPAGAPTTPKKTPIPFPQLSSHKTKLGSGKDIEATPTGSRVLVPETPPSKTPKQTPVPFPPTMKKAAATTEHRPSKKDRRTVLLSSLTTNKDSPTPSIAPATVATSNLPSVPNALTDANLRSFKAPLSEVPKPRPRGKTAASTVTSVRTSSASMSIQEAFARVGKPYVRSAAENDPFSPNDKPKKVKKREEASLDVFNEKFLETAKAVDWHEEAKYLNEYLEWSHDHQEVHCLNKMTSCSAKKEELIRQNREENVESLAQLETSKDDLAKLTRAAEQGQRAQDLLMLATTALVPVPIGIIEGKWTLSCPQYAEKHFDKYGYGQRELTISSIAGFRYNNTFTARLHLPPRTMSFTILSFTTPPHASFRTTTLRTASEGSEMDVLFLGNGFLHLRMNMKELLQGKNESSQGQENVMEFIGVHEQAMSWDFEGKDEVEEGKKLFAKYDGNSADE